MSLPWHINDERNFSCMTKIVTNIISNGLRTIFKQEWDNRYQATLGVWDNTAKNGIALHNIEQGRRRGREHLPKFLNGNINEWDCTVLFDAILYSKSIGQASLNPAISNEIDKLRKVRNKFSHPSSGELSDSDFENDSEAVRKSFLALGLPTKDIDEIKAERKRVESFKVLPPQPTHEVIHRTATATIINDLENLHNNDINGDLTYFYISGNPGSGKSLLASQVGESHYNEEIKKPNAGITFLMTLNAESLDTLLASYEDFARRTNCPDATVASILNSKQVTEVKIRNLRTQIAKRMEIYKNWLVIVDNVENLKLVTPLLPERKNDEWKGGQLLITTQESAHIPPSNSFTGHVAVSPGLDENESCELLTKLSGKGEDDPDVLKKVAKELDYQPLALAAAAVYLQQVRESKVSPEFSWDDYLQKLKEGKRELTEEILDGVNPAYSTTMTTAVRLAVEKAAKNDVILKHTFHFLSLASHESLPLEVVIDYVVSIDKDQDKEQVGLKIRKCSLVLQEENDKVVSIRLHQVVHDGMKFYAKEREMEATINSIEVAARSFYQLNKKNDKTLVPHLKAFHDAMKKMLPNSETLYPGKPSSEILSIFCDFGLLLQHYGYFLHSKGFLTAALWISKKKPEVNPFEVAGSYSNLGTTLLHLGDLQQAKQHFEKALNICTELQLSNHVYVATLYNNLGSVHKELVELEQAKQYYEKALQINIELLGSNNVDVALSYNNLGLVYIFLDDLQQAKKYHEKALHIHTEQLGSNHVVAATSYNNLGAVHKKLGDLQQANQYYEKALHIYTEQLGPNHVNVATLYNNLGEVHNEWGHLEQAKQYYEKAIHIRTEQLGPSHKSLRISYKRLGKLHKALGNLQQAKQYLEKVLQIFAEQVESNDIEVAIAYCDAGNINKDLGDLQQAKQYHEKGEQIYLGAMEKKCTGVTQDAE